jgi:hypothetical protein
MECSWRHRAFLERCFLNWVAGTNAPDPAPAFNDDLELELVTDVIGRLVLVRLRKPGGGVGRRRGTCSTRRMAVQGNRVGFRGSQVERAEQIHSQNCQHASASGGNRRPGQCQRRGRSISAPSSPARTLCPTSGRGFHKPLHPVSSWSFLAGWSAPRPGRTIRPDMTTANARWRSVVPPNSCRI